MAHKLLYGLIALALTGVAVPKAKATSITFTLNVDFCSQPCGGTTSTVTLTDSGSGIPAGSVQVTVNLSGVDFHQTNGLDAFLFNSLASGYTISGQTSGFVVGPAPTAQEDGAGIFGYSLQLDCGSANHCVGGTSLTFLVTDSAHDLTVASLETKGSGASVDFAANVTNGTCTGLIGGGDGTAQSTATTMHSGSTTCSAPPNPTPEPTSILLLGTILAFAGKFALKQLSA